MKTDWPSKGPDCNNWHVDLKEFMDILFDAENDAFWCADFDLKYLTIRVDTRDNNWLLFADGRGDDVTKVRIDPQRVIDAIDKWRMVVSNGKSNSE